MQRAGHSGRITRCHALLACAAREVRITRAQDGRNPLRVSQTRPAERPMPSQPAPSPRSTPRSRSAARALYAREVSVTPAQAWWQGSSRACVLGRARHMQVSAGRRQHTLARRVRRAHQDVVRTSPTRRGGGSAVTRMTAGIDSATSGTRGSTCVHGIQCHRPSASNRPGNDTYL